MGKSITAREAESSPELLESIWQWTELANWLIEAKRREASLRLDICNSLFPLDIREEGTNRVKLDDGSILTLVHSINRTLDESALDSVMQQLPETSDARKLDHLITYKPSIVLSGLRTLNESEQIIFAQAYVEKIGMPQLAIELSAPQEPLDKSDDSKPAKKAAKKAAKKVAKKTAKKK